MEKLIGFLTEDNSLFSAYQAVLDGNASTRGDLLVDEYARYFAVPPVSEHVNHRSIEKFSLTDPSIRTVVRSTTATV